MGGGGGGLETVWFLMIRDAFSCIFDKVLQPISRSKNDHFYSCKIHYLLNFKEIFFVVTNVIYLDMDICIRIKKIKVT